MSLKNSQGFTVVEVLLTLAIIGMVLTPIYILQGGSTRAVAQAGRLYDRVVAGYSMLMETVFIPEAKKDATKKISEPEAVLTLSTKTVSEQSSLKNIPALELHHIVIDWSDRRKKKQDRIVAFTFKQEEKSA